MKRLHKACAELNKFAKENVYTVHLLTKSITREERNVTFFIGICKDKTKYFTLGDKRYTAKNAHAIIEERLGRLRKRWEQEKIQADRIPYFHQKCREKFPNAKINSSYTQFGVEAQVTLQNGITIFAYLRDDELQFNFVQNLRDVGDMLGEEAVYQALRYLPKKAS